jgi:chromosome segregation ATPase
MNPLDQPTSTPTPRTDEAVRLYRFLGKGPLELEGRFADFARSLECELAAAKAECKRLKFALVEWEAKERGWSKAVEKDAAELTRLRAEVERWQGIAATCSQEREHNANEAGRLRAEVERLNEQCETNKRSISNAHTAIDESGILPPRDKTHQGLTPRVKSIIARAEKAEAELANIANAKPDTWGDMSDSFQAWAQNRARHALAAMKGTT